jgi:hypothetical protein
MFTKKEIFQNFLWFLPPFRAKKYLFEPLWRDYGACFRYPNRIFDSILIIQPIKNGDFQRSKPRPAAIEHARTTRSVREYLASSNRNCYAGRVLAR